ncbi:GAF domain-containing protein [Streptomyces sp. OE57]|uniref:GAF domain-containing sensor histidine kinase n=1 Tax=Streptomyces lacaronensis TaxID=3379885 RepID=UPI0039B74FCA
MLDDLVGASTEGVAVIDAEGSCIYANETARHLLAAQDPGDLTRLLRDASLHVTRLPFVSAGRSLTAFLFHDAERVERQLHKVAAFARTAARIACRGPLQEVLDRVAVEARNATGALACSIILLEPDGFRVRLVGTAGHTDDYIDRLTRSVELGAPLASFDAFRTGRPARRDRLHELAERDPRYAPFVSVIEQHGWDDVVAVPTVVQGRSVGVLTSFFSEDERPTEDDITFLVALADQTATAVDNANLVAELQLAAAAAERQNLAIDLHDSVSQALFSLIIQSRALAMRARGHEPGGEAGLLDAISRLESTAEELQREIRALLRQMQPENPRSQGFGEDLAALRDRLAQLTQGDSPELRLELPEGDLPPVEGATRQELLRVLQEAGTNSVRHAAATEITIRLTAADDFLVAVVEDNGVGFRKVSHSPGHLGLQSMTRRTARLGGQLDIDTSVTGTAVRVTLPLRSHSTRAEK